MNDKKEENVDCDVRISIQNDNTCIVNNSPWILVISQKPKKPKRKHIDIAIVKPGSNIIYEGIELNIEGLSFSFKRARSDESLFFK